MREHGNFCRITVLLAVALLSFATIFHTLSLSKNPGFLQYEILGTAPKNFSLEELCSDNLLAGMEGPFDQTSAQRASSMYYRFSERLLPDFLVNPETFHRNITAVFYLIALTLFIALCVMLGFHFYASLFLIIFYATSDKLVSAVFTVQLICVSLIWLFGNFILFRILTNKRKQRFALNYAAIIGLGLSLAASYDAYAVVRALSVFLWPVSLAHIALRRNGKQLSVFLLSTAIGLIALQFIHPNITYDLTLFSGRNETVFDMENVKLKPIAGERLSHRAKDLKLLFEWSDNSNWYAHFIGVGWLEIWVLLIGALALCLAVPKVRRITLKDIHSDKWFIAYVCITLALGITFPSLSVFRFRPTRLFLVYPTTLILLGYFLTRIFSCVPKKKSFSAVFTLFGFVLISCFLIRLHAIQSWQSKNAYLAANQEIRNLIQELREQEPHDAGGESFVIEICDNRPSRYDLVCRAQNYCDDCWRHSRCLKSDVWLYSLLVSEFYCKLPGEGVLKYPQVKNMSAAETCECKVTEKNCRRYELKDADKAIKVYADQ